MAEVAHHNRLMPSVNKIAGPPEGGPGKVWYSNQMK